jgi:hypothetical protein
MLQPTTSRPYHLVVPMFNHFSTQYFNPAQEYHSVLLQQANNIFLSHQINTNQLTVLFSLIDQHQPPTTASRTECME